MNNQNILQAVQQVCRSMTLTKTLGQHNVFMDYIMELRNSKDVYMPITGVNVHGDDDDGDGDGSSDNRHKW